MIIRIAIALCLSASAAQAQSVERFGDYINGLPSATAPGSGDQLYLRQGGVSKQVPFSTLEAQRGIVPNCVGNGIADDTACMQSALNTAVANGVPLLVGFNNTKYLITSTLTSSGVVHIEGFAPVGNDGVSNAQRCLNGFTAEGHAITLLSLTGPKVIIHNLCMQMGTPGVLTGASGAAILLGGSDQGHDDISGNTIFWPYDGIQVGGAGGLVRASDISHNVIRSPARYGIAIGMGTINGATAGITMTDNQIGCDTGATGTGMAIFDGAVIVDGTNNGPNNCLIGTLIAPGTNQNANGQFSGVMGDSDVNNDLKIAPTSTGVINFLNFTRVWAAAAGASLTTATSVAIDCPGSTLCSEIIFDGLTAHGTVNQTTPIIDIARDAGGPRRLTIANSTICSFGGAGGGEVALRLNLGSSGPANWLISNNRIGAPCGTPGTTATPIGIGIIGTGGIGNSTINILGNDLSESATPISYTPNNETINISNNLGVDNVCPSVTTTGSGGAISLPNAATCVHLTGTTTINEILSSWVTRTVRVISDSGLTLAVGGATHGFCGASVTLVAAQQSILTWNNENACWLHTP